MSVKWRLIRSIRLKLPEVQWRQLLFRSQLPRTTALLLTFFMFLFFEHFREGPLSVVDELHLARVSDVITEPPFQYFLSACVIVRESSDLMPEFLVRNFAAGIDHFFIYGDDDDPLEKARLKEVFKTLHGLVTYIPDGRGAPVDEEDPENYVQMRMYRHCLQEYGPTSQWVALIDTDEFFETLSLPFTSESEEVLSRRAFLHDVLYAHQMFPILCVRWKTALTNGRLHSLNRGETLDDLFPSTCRMQVNNKEKLSLRKTILQPRFVDMEKSPRLDVAIHKGFKFKGTKKKLNCVGGFGHNLDPPIHLVHYWSRDLSSYLRKIQRGRPRKGIAPRSLADLFQRERMCILETKSGSASLRKEFIRGIICKMPFFDTFPSGLPTSEMATGVGNNSTDFQFCQRRVSRLIAELSNGKSFSKTAYCADKISEACTLSENGHRESWPFPWAEYLLNCDKTFEEDSLFE